MKHKLNFYKIFFMAFILFVFWIISWGGLTVFALVGFVTVFETAVWSHVVLIVAIINVVCGFGLIYINRRFSELPRSSVPTCAEWLIYMKRRFSKLLHISTRQRK